MASEKVKGLSIKLSADTTAVNSALSTLNKTLGSTQKELNQVDKLLKLDPKNVNLLTQKQGLLSSAINDTKLKLEQLNKVKELADKDTNVDKNSKQYRDLATQIEATRIKLAQYENQQEGVNKSLKDGEKNASAFGDILKAKVVGDAIVKGAEALGNAFLNIGKGIYNSVRDSGRLADDINTLAKQFNLSTTEIQQFMKASDLIDVDLSTITKSFNKLTMSMTSDSKKVKNAFKTLGIALKDNDGNLRSSNEVFYETIEALSKIPNETEQDALALQIFGKSSAELGTLINGGAEELAKFNKYLEENNLLLSQEELDGLNGMNDAFDKLSITFDSIKQKLASELAPVIQPLVEDLTKYIIDNKDDIVAIVKDIVDNLTSQEMKDVYEGIKETLSNIIDFMINSVPNLIQDIKDILGALQPVLTILRAIVDAIKFIDSHSTDMYGGYSSYAEMRRANMSGGYSSGGFGELQSSGYTRNMTSNLTINVNTNQAITERDVRGWASIINEELGGAI